MVSAKFGGIQVFRIWECAELRSKYEGDWLRNRDTFTAAAIKYKEHHGKGPVLVVDNANRLAKYQLELLDNFQDAAKVASDSVTFGAVFVSSEGNVPARCAIHSICLLVYREECVVEAREGAQHWRYIPPWIWREIARSNIHFLLGRFIRV